MIATDETTASAPITLNQERRLAYEEGARAAGMHVTPFHLFRGIALDGALDEDALARALDLLVSRHGALRTAFTPTRVDGRTERIGALLTGGVVHPGLYRQTVHQQATLDVLRVSSPEASVEGGVATDGVQDVCTRPFDYERPPLMRAVLIDRPAEPRVLVLVVHHLIADRDSLGVLQGDLQRCYDHVVSDGRTPLPAVSLPYETAMQAFDRLVHDHDIERSVTYWWRQWSRYGPAQVQLSDFTCASRAGAGPATASDRVQRTLDQTELARIKECARRAKVTLHVAGLAALAVLVAEHTGRQAVGIWSNFDNRWRLEAEEIVAWLVHSHMLGIEVQPGSRAQHLTGVRQAVLGAMSHAHLPLSEFCRRVGLSLGRRFRVGFGVSSAVGANEATSGPSGVSLRRVPVLNVQSVTNDLDLQLYEGLEQASFDLRFRTGHFTTATAQRMLDRYLVILEQLVADPAAPLSTV